MTAHIDEKRYSEDGKPYALAEFIDFCGEDDGRWFWSKAMPERRISEDGKGYTLKEFIAFCGEEDGLWFFSKAETAPRVQESTSVDQGQDSDETNVVSQTSGPTTGKGKTGLPAKGKGKGKAPIAPKPKPKLASPKPKPAPTAPDKMYAGMVFYWFARLQLEDGRWGKDTRQELAKHFSDPSDRDAFLATSDYYITVVLLTCGQIWLSGILGYDTRIEKSVKLGDGRTTADKVETKVVGISAEETQERITSVLEAAQARLDWREAAEAWLKNQAIEEAGEGGLNASELRAKADLAKYFVMEDGFQKKAPGRQNLSDEEKQKREQARMEKEATMRRKEEEQRAIAAARKAHYAGLQPADINNVPWENAVEINVCAGGSGGAALIDLGSSCVVLKTQGKSASNEMLAQHLANALNIPVAQMRVVKHGEAEYSTIKSSAKPCRVVSYEPHLAFTQYFGLQINQSTGIPEDYGREVGLFGILEFVAGHPLMGLEGNEVLAAPKETLLTSLGRLCSLDVLINNLDRVPLPVWTNEGNMGNVMVSSDGTKVVGIDQQVNTVKAGVGCDKYLQGARDMVASVVDGGDPKLIIAKLRACFDENCAAELPEANANLFLQGLRLGFQEIAHAWNNGKLKQALDSGIAHCLDRFTITWDVSGRSRAWPCLDNLEDMQEFVCKVAAEIAVAVGKADN